ncbi:MAG: hypothetical protein ACREA7_01775 [Nitrosotalea sp.]
METSWYDNMLAASVSAMYKITLWNQARLDLTLFLCKSIMKVIVLANVNGIKPRNLIQQSGS